MRKIKSKAESKAAKRKEPRVHLMTYLEKDLATAFEDMREAMRSPGGKLPPAAAVANHLLRKALGLLPDFLKD